jgi:hypothetical protein
VNAQADEVENVTTEELTGHGAKAVTRDSHQIISLHKN